MKKKNRILIILIALFATSFILITGFLSQTSAKEKQSTCCSQKGINCDAKANSPATGEIITENLSRQFLSIFPLGR